LRRWRRYGWLWSLPLNKAFENSGIESTKSPGIKRATASEVNSAVQAITHLPQKIRKLLINPIWPITTALGSVLRAVAALKKLGVMKEVPRPATKHPNEKTPNAQYLWVSPKRIEAITPNRKNIPPIAAPILADLFSGIQLIIRDI
jgi:hypothetical protein